MSFGPDGTPFSNGIEGRTKSVPSSDGLFVPHAPDTLEFPCHVACAVAVVRLLGEFLA